jgi:hypothetical protein
LWRDDSSKEPILFLVASMVRSAAFRSRALSFAKTCSIKRDAHAVHHDYLCASKSHRDEIDRAIAGGAIHREGKRMLHGRICDSGKKVIANTFAVPLRAVIK